jgi:hypothetical protein
MPPTDASYVLLVRGTIAATPVHDRLRSSDAVVLERIARGGGATCWYYCRDHDHLGRIEEMLSPGSVVSFYFDGRLRRSGYSSRLLDDINEVLKERGEVVVGSLATDGLRIEASIVVSSEDLRECLAEVGTSSPVFYGTFPARDNDGVAAVTVTLPDRDGVRRAHPH